MRVFDKPFVSDGGVRVSRWGEYSGKPVAANGNTPDPGELLNSPPVTELSLPKAKSDEPAGTSAPSQRPRGEG
jgi:hypothetical protein